jgi:nucleotide-binding universal stress UspA family protein
MTIILAYVEDTEGDAAARAAVAEALLRSEPLVAVSGSREQRLDLQQVRQHIESLAPEAAGLEITVVTPDLHDPSDAIIQEAQRENASLIVVGMHRRSRVGKLFLGSTAQRILLEATCSVLAVRADSP